MSHDIQPVPDRGSWDLNTAEKANVLLSMREKHRGTLLYVDADAFVHRDVTDELQTSADIGFHFFAGPPKGHNARNVCGCLKKQPCTREHRLLAGTILLGDTQGCRALLTEWVRFNRMRQDGGHMSGGGQKNLWAVWDAMQDDIVTERLPGRLCYVFDKPYGYPRDEPVWIEHTIASRENRPSREMEAGFWRRAHHGRQRRVRELWRLVA